MTSGKTLNGCDPTEDMSTDHLADVAQVYPKHLNDASDEELEQLATNVVSNVINSVSGCLQSEESANGVIENGNETDKGHIPILKSLADESIDQIGKDDRVSPCDSDENTSMPKDIVCDAELKSDSEIPQLQEAESVSQESNTLDVSAPLEISVCHSVEDIVSYNESCSDQKKSEDSAGDIDVPETISQLDLERKLANNLSKGDSEEKPNKLTDQQETGEQILTSSEDEWLDVLGNGLLKKKVLKKGQGDSSRPQRGQEVTITMETRLLGGSTVQGPETLKLVLAERDVVDALDLSLTLAEKGETCVITSDAKYCYGAKGLPPNILPNSDLEFTVTVEEIEEGPYNISTPINKRLAWVDLKRTKGNKLYSEKNFNEAIHAYNRCSRVLQQASNQSHPDDVKAEISSLSCKCYNNLAAAHMMTEEWGDALQACQKAEKLDENNVKTLFRKGKILIKLGELNKALEALKKASKFSPEDKGIQLEITRVTKKLQTQKDTQQKMYQRMFWGKEEKQMPNKEEKENKENSSSWFSQDSFIVGGSLVAIGAFLIGAYFLHR